MPERDRSCPRRAVVLSPRARADIEDLYTWIADSSGFPDRALAFTEALLTRCEELSEFPFVGQARDDLREGLRLLGFRRRAAIAYAVTDETVEILAVYYGGQHISLLGG